MQGQHAHIMGRAQCDTAEKITSNIKSVNTAWMCRESRARGLSNPQNVKAILIKT